MEPLEYVGADGGVIGMSIARRRARRGAAGAAHADRRFAGAVRAGTACRGRLPKGRFGTGAVS